MSWATLLRIGIQRSSEYDILECLEHLEEKTYITLSGPIQVSHKVH